MKEAIRLYLKKGFFLSPNVLKDLEKINSFSIDENSLVLDLLDKKEKEIKTKEIEIIESYEEKSVKISVNDFVNLYNKRFQAIQSILRQRKELESAISIRRVLSSQNKETVCFIACVSEMSYTKNNNLILVLEDQTGTINAIVTKNKEINIKEISLDETIGVIGTKSDNAVFVNSIVFPDVPIRELKKTREEEAAIFISDLHIGSKAFLKENFEFFIDWLCGKINNIKINDIKQKEIIKKIKYLFILGDIVDGIGIYPEQEKDLLIKDIYEQYSVFSEYIKKIPRNINIIICPGNHDTLRIAEPQPSLPKDFVPELYNMENVFFVSNPSIVKIGKKENFSGFDVLIYHGFSFPYYADAIESLRLNGGLQKTENIMVYLLKKRHLAPTHGSTQYQLGYEKDPLVISNVPDFFVSGHVHRASARNYKNITLLNCACWISQTEYQEKRGLIPEPARAIYVDLSTRETKILNFENASK